VLIVVANDGPGMAAATNTRQEQLNKELRMTHLYSREKILAERVGDGLAWLKILTHPMKLINFLQHVPYADILAALKFRIRNNR
jgi:hypothetical protein